MVGTISRLDRRKGNDIVIKAIQKLAGTYPGLKYLIGGIGSEEESLRSLTLQCGLSDRVVFAGRIPERELVRHYDILDAYVMPNRLMADDRVEGFGISFVEAASRGVPSIGVDNGGVSDALSDGLSGILIPTADVDEVVTALDRILKGNTSLGKKVIREFGRQFSWETFVDTIERPGHLSR